MYYGAVTYCFNLFQFKKTPIYCTECHIYALNGREVIEVFSIIWDEKKQQYKVKQTELLSLEEVMRIYATYKYRITAQKILKGLNKRKD